MNIGLINGLPSHPFFVHGAVVLVPLTALALVVCALRPSAARRLGWMLPGAALAALVLVVLSTESGEWLEKRVPESALLEKHAELAPGLTPWAIALFVPAVAVWLLGHAAAREERARGRDAGGPAGKSGRPAGSGASTVLRLASSTPVRVAVLVIALGVALGAVVDVYRIGDSGARAVWQGGFSTSRLATWR
ncbi:DUF2231 domain-containing protein [Streptomyces hebeiensis]